MQRGTFEVRHFYKKMILPIFQTKCLKTALRFYFDKIIHSPYLYLTSAKL